MYTHIWQSNTGVRHFSGVICEIPSPSCYSALLYHLINVVDASKRTHQKPAWKHVASRATCFQSGSLHGLSLDPEVGGGMFLWNVGRLSTDDTAFFSQKVELFMMYFLCKTNLTTVRNSEAAFNRIFTFPLGVLWRMKINYMIAG
jgi:hypothetical protein